jgi:hypothetical protein
MAVTCFLSEMDRRHFERRAEWSFVSEAPRAGWFRLFNTNALTTLFVRPMRPCEARFGWIVEVEAVPPYFRHVLREVDA